MATAALLILLSSCGKKETKPGSGTLIPDEKLAEILTDIYLTTGVMDLPPLSQTWGQRDSVLNYVDVVAAHGYRYSALDSTMKYYFNEKPRKLSHIYDMVTGRLQEMEARIREEGTSVTESRADGNLWNGRASYNFPEDVTRDPLWFDIPATKPGLYTLKADYVVYDDDRSLDPRVTVFFSITDSLGKESKVQWDEVRLDKNGQVRPVEIRRLLEKPEGVRIKGWLLNHTSQKGLWQKHARVSGISLTVDTLAVIQAQ